MNKAFRKGELVTYISSWDNKGTFSYTQAVVHSCGKVQMVLTEETSGREMGRHFKPAVADTATLSTFNWNGTFKRMSDAEAEALCLKLGAELPAVFEAENARREAWNVQQGRTCLCPHDLNELHEPRALKR